MRAWLALAVVALTAAGGCAAVLGIPDRSATLCARETHDLCEDFDNRQAAYIWNGPDGGEDPRAAITIVPSDQTPPNAISLRFPAIGATDAVQGLIGSSFQRSADGLRVAFDVRVDELGLPPDGGGMSDARPLPLSALAIAVVQWNSGGMAIVLLEDGAYIFHGPRAPDAPVSSFESFEPLAPRADVVGKWSHVQIGLVFDVTPPVVEVRFGSRPSINPQLTSAITQVQRTTDILFGVVLLGPSESSAVTFDNLVADFRKPVTP
jgi:hypothetical protein